MKRGGINLYEFAANDPINKWDYLGYTTGGQILSEYLKPRKEPDPGEKLWVMDSNDDYTKIVRAWDAVKNAIAGVKAAIVSNPAYWKQHYMTKAGWRPSTTGNLVVPNANRTQVTSPKGTDPATAATLYSQWKLTGSEPGGLSTAVIGSFTLFATIDSIDTRLCTAKVNIWMFNRMSQESFGQFSSMFPDSYQRSQFMWWNWKEEFGFWEVPSYSGSKNISGGGGW